MKPTNVLVSHPGKQGNVYQRPRAAEQAGCDVTFLTGLYYFPKRFPYSLVRLLPAERRKNVEKELEKRTQEGLSDSNVISLWGPILETLLRPAGRMEEWGAIHDKLASRWLRKRPLAHRPNIVHCFQQSATRTLNVAKQSGAVRILEVTLPPVPAEHFDQIAENSPSFRKAQEHAAAKLRGELERADWVVAQSVYSVNSITALGFPYDRIIGVPLGVDINVFCPATNQRKDKMLLQALFVGTIGRRKGVHHLLRAWMELDLPNWQLTIVGNNQTPEARELLASCNGKVAAVGNMPFERLLQTYQSADLLVHPSLAEGGCNVVHEALACGVPCVVSANATSAVRDGIEGYVVPVGDVASLKEKISTLAASPNLRNEMANAARQRATELSWDAYVARLGAIYQALGNNPTSMPAAGSADLVFNIQRNSK